MTARDYLIKTDLNIRIAIENGYDIRLDESEILEKMEGYHQAKLKLLNIMTQDKFNKAPKLDQILYDCTGMLVKNHPDIEEAMQKYADQQLIIQGDAISLARAEKYGRHQHHLGTQQKALVSLEDWRQD